MELNMHYRRFAETFAEAIVTEDFTSAHRMLAPWLQPTITPEKLQDIVKAEVRETAEANGLEGELHPTSYEIGWNSCGLQDLLEPRSYASPREVSPEVTVDNFRQWMKVQFQPGADEAELEIDAYMDWWMIVVEEDGEYWVGYFEIEDPD